jgi:hypothetical protein
MSLFFDVLSSINNPNQQGSIEQLGSVTQSLQQLAATQGLSSSQMSGLLTALGPALLQQKGLLGNGQLGGLMGQLAGAGAGASALQSAIPPQIQQQIAQVVAQKTGLSPSLIQSLLPQVLPAVLGLLGMGATKPGVGGGDNPLLSAFLDSDRSGSTDLGDVFKFADRFLNPPR